MTMFGRISAVQLFRRLVTAVIRQVLSRPAAPRRRRYALSFEGLEGRVTPAVTATFAGGVLTLTGDSANDSVSVEGSQSAGVVVQATGLSAQNTFSGVT